MDKLRATFIAGPQTGITAQNIFTDRITELEAFHGSLKKIIALRSTSGHKPSLDMTAPRRNIMVYYGLGGIGKTALSRQLERRLDEGSLDHSLPKHRVTTRVDFGESGAFDLEEILLRLRADLGELRVSWPAFDFAFKMYWERSHPGEPLPEFIRRNSALRRHVSRFDFAEQMQNIFSQVLTELGMAWTPTRMAIRLASLTQEHLMRSITYRRLSEQCPFLEPIVTADSPDDSLSYTPSLLAWELDRTHEPYLVVLFLDTFEAIGGRDTREAERLVQRLVFLMPMVLFVVTSRNYLDWALDSETHELDYTGLARWPQLHLENKDLEPRQHLVGSLSIEDCELYLCTVLQNDDGTPLIEASVRDRIIQGSGGLPLYLDLSVTQYLEFKATGAEIRAEAFGGPLSSVVTRIMRNLDREERNILRGVSLLDSFDVGLAHAASDSPDAKTSRFVNSSLVTRTSGLAWPYALHSQLRKTIQEGDVELRDAWSIREWRAAAERICEHLGEISEAARNSRDRAAAASCFTQAVRLANYYDAVPSWVLEAAQFLADAGLWRALDVRLQGEPSRSSATTALVQGLRGITLRRSGSLEGSVSQFDAALTSSALGGQARGLLRLHRAHSLRNSGRYTEAQTEYEQIAREGGPYVSRATLQIADLHLLRGEFQEALRVLDDMPDEDQDVLGESLRIRGHVYRANANFDAAELIYRRALELGRHTKSVALEGKALTNIAETLCWTKPDEGLRVADDAISFNSAIGNQLEVLKDYVARAVACRADQDADAAISEALTLVDFCKYRAGAVFALAARLFHQVLRNDRSANDTAVEILQVANTINVYHYWHEIVSWWLEASPISNVGDQNANYPSADWLGLPELARQRWMDVLNTRRENHE